VRAGAAALALALLAAAHSISRADENLPAAAASAVAPAAPVAAAASAVRIVHSNDVLGELEPCGCRENPLGGLARKANWLRKLAPDPLIQLDAGDLLFSTLPVPEALARQARLQASYMLKALDQLGHDAAVPGEKDFALGVATFDALRKGTKVRFLAANLKRRKGGAFLPPYALLERKLPGSGKGVRVAVLGLVGEALPWPVELRATPALAAARALVPQLRKRADWVVALTHQGFEKDRELAAAVPGIDLVIGGHSQSFLQTPTVVANAKGAAWLLQSSFRNQYVGNLRLERPLTEAGYALTGLDAGLDSPAEAPGPMDALVREFRTAIAQLNSEETEQLEAEARAGPHGTAPSAGKFHTFPRCAECHLKQFDFWRRTPHARAFHALFAKGDHKNKECLSCHSVGLGDPQGFQDVQRLAEAKSGDQVHPVQAERLDSFLEAMRGARDLDTRVPLPHPSPSGGPGELPLRQAIGSLERSWTPVQCESCHQPGRDHPFSGAYAKKVVDQRSCFACHTTERAPAWYGKDGRLNQDAFAARRAKVTCPAGELREED
jgi:hypothetical protein